MLVENIRRLRNSQASLLLCLFSPLRAAFHPLAFTHTNYLSLPILFFTFLKIGCPLRQRLCLDCVSS